MIKNGRLQQNLISVNELGKHFSDTTEALEGIQYTDFVRTMEEYDTPGPLVFGATPNLTDVDPYNVTPEQASSDLSSQCRLYIKMLKIWSYYLAAEVVKFGD